MPPSPADLRRFIRDARRARRAVTSLERSTLREVVLLMREARAELLVRIAQAGGRAPDPLTPFGATELRTRLVAVDATIRALERELGSVVGRAGQGAVDLSVAYGNKVLKAAGADTFPLLTRIPSSPVIVAQGEYLGSLIQDVTEEARRKIKTALRLSVAGGKSIADLEATVRRSLDGPLGNAASRAERIVRTELGRTYEIARDAQREVVTNAGFIVTRRWLTAKDDRVRPEHLALDGVEVAEGEDFDVGGFPAAYPQDPRLPAHLAINCRCTVADIVVPNPAALVGSGAGSLVGAF